MTDPGELVQPYADLPVQRSGFRMQYAWLRIQARRANPHGTLAAR